MLILKNNMKKKDLVTLLSSIFIFVFIWIGFNIYHNSVTSTIEPLLNAKLSPIAPTFDTKTIDSLKKRQSVTPAFQLSAPVNPPITAPPDTSLLISTESAKQATIGGSLL